MNERKVAEETELVYSNTNTTSSVIAELKRGDEVVVTKVVKSSGANWCAVVLPDGAEGYVPPPFKSFKIRRAILGALQGSVDVLVSPTADSKVRITIRRGDQFTIMGGGVTKEGERSWVEIQTDSGDVGFIPADTRIKDVAPNESNKYLRLWENLYRSSMATPIESFGITLTCPDCQPPLDEYKCPRCEKERASVGAKSDTIAAIGGRTLFSLWSFLFPIALGVVGALFFGGVGGIIGVVLGGSITALQMRDYLGQKTKKDAARSGEVLLAQRYQKSSQTYDQAAVCYINWFKKVGYFEYPNWVS